MSNRFGYDIHRTDSHESLGLEDDRPVRWLVVCRSCGKTMPRMKRSALVEHPERYPTLVVRVSGFSAFYVTLDRDVQVDILNRTQQE